VKEMLTILIVNFNSADFIGDVRNYSNVFFEENFDLVLCCQVLEHLPYSDFSIALRNLYSITKKYLIITLAYTSKGTFKPYFKINIFPFFKPMACIKIFNFFPKEHIFNGQHYWEIGKKGYKLKRILKDIRKNGFRLIKSYPIFENPYHYVIVCEKEGPD